MPNCSVCGKPLIETTATTLKCPTPDQHAKGEPKVGSAILECPVKKGAIWVYLTDDAGTGLRNFPTTVAKAPVPGPKPTDALGFSAFDPLDPADDYSVKIQIPDLQLDSFYPPPRTEITSVPVRTGEITSVEFKLERVAPLTVSVDYPVGFPGKLGIQVTGTSPDFNPASPMAEHDGFVVFPKLRRHNYTAAFTLTDQQKKLYRIEGGGAKPWSHDPYGANEVKFKVIAVKLVRLEVVGASDLTGEHFWCVADPVKKVRVKAITEPNDSEAWAQLTWSAGTPSGNKQEAVVDITAAGDFIVKADLDAPQSVTIEVYDILTVDCPLPKKLSATKWKAYASNQVTRLKVTTKPDEERVWKHLVWSEGTPTASKNECDVELQPVGDRTVTVSLDGKTLPAELHICQWPRLEIAAIDFASHEVLNDGAAEIGVPFDKAWEKGRPDPAAHVPAATCQSPLCFTMGTNIDVKAHFNVTTPPTEDETVTIKGTCIEFGEVRTDILVQSTDLQVSTPAIQSTRALPAWVACEDAWRIDWEHLLEDNATWVSADTSTHLLYVTLRDPQADVYFTLLDISCRAAAFADNENDLVSQSFVPFTTHTDDGNGFPRKGDDEKLSYYKDGVNTGASDDEYTTHGMLGSANATGRCGGWADLLVHMWKIHGVTATQRWFIRGIDAEHADMKKRFLVKNCDFSAPATLVGRYSHAGVATLKQDGAPGQGKKNPQFDFGDHVIVKHAGMLYDPSYGLNPCATDAAYLAVALDGLGSTRTGRMNFTMADGTPQFISNECVPYAGGFAEYKIARQTLQDIAGLYGETDWVLYMLDAALALLRADPADVVPGDTVVVPVFADGSFDIAATAGFEISHTLRELVTFDMIAAAHGVTKQAILDDPANAALKLARVTPAGVTVGDTIVVTSASAPGGDWVIGHDQ